MHQNSTATPVEATQHHFHTSQHSAPVQDLVHGMLQLQMDVQSVLLDSIIADLNALSALQDPQLTDQALFVHAKQIIFGHQIITRATAH